MQFLSSQFVVKIGDFFNLNALAFQQCPFLSKTVEIWAANASTRTSQWLKNVFPGVLHWIGQEIDMVHDIKKHRDSSDADAPR